MAEYAADMKQGAQFPPVDVFYDGENYWLAHGFHRRDAVDWRGQKEIECEVHPGTLEDALWYSFGVNKTQDGMRRTNEDKQRAVKGALMHPKGKELSDHQIAEHVGVAVSTVGGWRKRLEPIYSIPTDRSQVLSDQHEPERRTATRKGKTYKINVGKVGKRRRRPQDPAVQSRCPYPGRIRPGRHPAPARCA